MLKTRFLAPAVYSLTFRMSTYLESLDPFILRLAEDDDHEGNQSNNKDDEADKNGDVCGKRCKLDYQAYCDHRHDLKVRRKK